MEAGRGRKLMVWVVGIIVVIIFAFVLWRPTNPPTNYPPKNDSIVAFGDSLVVGVGDENGGFVRVLSEKIGRPIENAGISGNTTEDGLLRLEEDVLQKDPGVVLLLLGGNDYLRRITSDETFSNLGEMIDRLHENGTVVVLLGVRGGVLRDNYGSKYKQLARSKNTAYVPNVLDGLLGDSDYMYDRIHPNTKGYERIADKIYLVLKEIIQ